MGKTKKIIYISTGFLLLFTVIFILRGPYISNAFKKAILPELENITGRKVIAQQIYLNIFPLFIEAKGLKVFDEKGNKILTAERAKAYIGLSNILKKEISIKKIVIKKPEIWTDEEQIDDISGKIKEYINKKIKSKFKIKLNLMQVQEGIFVFDYPEYDTVLNGKGLSGEFVFDEVPILKAKIKEFSINAENIPDLRYELNTMLLFKDENIDVRNLSLRINGSEIKSEGYYSMENSGLFKTNADLLIDSIKKVLNLKNRGEGKISARGYVKLEEGKPFVDFKIKGSFYLQTIMEMFKIKERLEGWLTVDTKISGALSDIKGEGEARLRNGNLFDVDITDLKCKVIYKDGYLNFKEGKGELYGGKGEAELLLKMPDIQHYTLKVKFEDVDGPSAFKLVGLSPGFSEGRAKGELYTSDTEFNPVGWFDYESSKTGKDFASRIKKIKGKYKVLGDTLTLDDVVANTDRTSIDIKGSITLSASILNLDGNLKTDDMLDISSPYFTRTQGIGEAAFKILGTFDDPLLKGFLKLNSVYLDKLFVGNVSSEISYRKKLLEISELTAESKNQLYIITGNIRFDHAKNLFDFNQPFYNLSVSMNNADLEKLTEIFYKKLPVKGRVKADIKIKGEGSNPEFSGYAAASELDLYSMQIDSVSTGFKYDHKNVVIDNAVVKKNGSLLSFSGRMNDNKNFSYKLFSEKLVLKDFGIKCLPSDSIFRIVSDGKGTLDNPEINFTSTLSGGTFKGKPLGSGMISAFVKNKIVNVDISLFNKKIKIIGKAYLDEKLPWNINIDVGSGRYDFMLVEFLKDVPDDLLLNLKGHAELSGTRNTISGSAVIDQINIALFGQSFSNITALEFGISNKKITFPVFEIRSGTSAFNTSGNIEIGRSYNIALEGSSSLSPLKAFSRNISVLRGDSEFTLSITGEWGKPHLNGSLWITDGQFALREFHQRISSIEGNFYFDEDKITMQRLSGKIGGGNINASGFIYLNGFEIKRFYLDTKLENITTAISKDFLANFNGSIFYKGTLDLQKITGDLRLNRASYKERVEWKSWLLKAKPKEKTKTELTRFEKAGLNIKISGENNIIVDNNIARTQLKVDTVLRGTVGHPLLFGRIESKGGKVYFRNNEFKVLSASADFTDPNRINPLMEIVAQTSVKGYNINLSLEGQIERFTLSLVSDPPLEETDILSLLTVGQIGKQTKGLEGGIGAGEAAGFLTGKTQDIIEDRMKNLTGFDRIQIDPYISKTTGTIGPRITVSKKLLGDRLFVTYSSAVGSTEEQILSLEYLLGKNVSLIGAKDERGSVGGDIKFRFEFK